MFIQYKFLSLLRLLFIAFIFAVFASNANGQNIAQQQLDNFVKNVNSATGAFTQEKVNDAGNSIDEQQQGDFAFARPGNFKWHVIKPYEQLTLANQKNLIQYDPDLEQVIIRDSAQSIGTSPASILFGQGDLNKQFEVNAIENHDFDKNNNEKLNWLRAKPRSNDAGFDYVDIGFVNSNLDVPQLSVILVKDGFGQTTLIKFIDIKVNPVMDDKEFLFNPPADVDVVNM